MRLTWLDSNSWFIETSDKKILLDPWLVGSLVFANQNWLFEGKKKDLPPIPEDIDLILLSQGLEDHAHTPTLKILNHNIPVVGSPNAAQVCNNFNYAHVNSLDHGQSFILDEQIEIKAVPGAPIGPSLVENAYIIRDLNNNTSVYYEPHGYHSPSLKEESVDIVITPITSLKILGFVDFIKGQKSALEACKLLNPKFILPTTTGGKVEYQGFLNTIISEEGTINDFSALLSQHNLDVKVIKPLVGEPVVIK